MGTNTVRGQSPFRKTGDSARAKLAGNIPEQSAIGIACVSCRHCSGSTPSKHGILRRDARKQNTLPTNGRKRHRTRSNHAKKACGGISHKKKTVNGVARKGTLDTATPSS